MLLLFLKTLLPTYKLPYSSLKPYPLKPLELPSKRLPFFPSHHFSTAQISCMEASKSMKNFVRLMLLNAKVESTLKSTEVPLSCPKAMLVLKGRSLPPKAKNLVVVGGLTAFVFGAYFYTKRVVGGTNELHVAIDTTRKMTYTYGDFCLHT
ncbi:hypothetical protein HKD37_18G050880 [Glycine soja]